MKGSIRRLLGVCAALAVSAVCLVPASGANAMPLADQRADWVPSQIQPTKYPLNWSRATLNDRVKVDKFGRRPIVGAESVLWFLACEREIQLDCIESVGSAVDGEYKAGSFFGATTYDLAPPWPQVAAHRTYWLLPGVKVGDREAIVTVHASFGGMDERGGFPGFNSSIELANAVEIPSAEDSLYGCPIMDRGECRRPEPLPQGTAISMTIRTSSLSPAVMMAATKSGDVKVEKLANGAHRITVTGQPTDLQATDRNRETYAVASGMRLRVYDPRLANVGFDECFAQSPIMFSFNANFGEKPQWDPKTGRLDLNLTSPHYWADGKTVWRGFYESVIPKAAAECLWGVDPRMANYLSVGVYGEHGEEKVSTTSVAFRDNAVRINAYDFTFSSNVVRAQLRVKAGDKCTNAGLRIQGYVCERRGSQLVWKQAKR